MPAPMLIPDTNSVFPIIILDLYRLMYQFIGTKHDETLTMASHHEQKCQDPVMENTAGVSWPGPDPTVNINDAGLDPFKTESSKEGEILESLHGPVGSELQECLFAKDKDNKSSVSKKDSKTLATSMPRYFLDDRSIVIFSDVCLAVLKTWGSYKNLQHLLKKQGIETSRFDQAQLRMLKKIRAVDVQTKQCSYIAEGDFIKILHKYDEENNTDNAKYLKFSPPVAIDNCCLATNVQGNQNGKEHSQVSLANTDLTTQNNIPSPFLIHVFSIGNHDFVTLSEISNMFESYFQQPHILNSVLQNLKVAIGTFTTNELAKIEIYTGITSDDSLRILYISRKDFERVLQYTSAFLDTNPPNVNWVQLGKLDVNVARKGVNKEGSVPVRLTSSSTSTATVAHIPENNIDVQGHEVVSAATYDSASSSHAIMTNAENSSALETASKSHSGLTCVIRTCLVNGEVVVCIPDLHKTVIDLYGHCVQVGNYMHRLKIPTHRFSTICLKRLKAHNILSSKATVCTYITKSDAERLLKMYHLGNHCDDGSGSFPGIEWSEPVVLESAVNNASEGHPSQVESMPISQSNQAKLKIPQFTINNQVVVSVPDVHKAVQLMNGQSVQLRYNLDKLGITKLKYTYSEVHHLKVLGHLNRPSSCTYITKSDVDRLLCYYITPENEARLKLIEWQPPVAVEKIVNITASDRQSSSPETESLGTEINDEDNGAGQKAEDYSISDLYRVFVGDELETIQHSSNESSDNQCEKVLQPTSPSSSASLPVYRFSPPSRHNFMTPITRNKENSVSDQLKSSSTASSYMSASQQLDLPAVNQSAINVTQMQVVVCSSSSDRDPVRSKALSTSSQTCCDRNDPVDTNQMAVSSQICSQVVPLPPSSFFTVPDSNMRTMHTHSMPVHVTSLTASSSVYSTCTAPVSRDGQNPSSSSTFTSSGKL